MEDRRRWRGTRGRRAAASLLVVIGAMLASIGTAQGATLTVDGVDNIFGAGHAVAPAPGGDGGGTLPPTVSFAANSGQILTFSSVTGLVGCAGFAGNGPDGDCFPASFAGNDINSTGGISGILDDNGNNMYLVGVFLDDSEPTDPAPARLDFSSAGLTHDFTTLSPEIGQTFFIGDGQTSGAVTQTFNVPPTATRLFLGFADAFNFNGDPGFYEDNVGAFSATFDIVDVVAPDTFIDSGPSGLTNDTTPTFTFHADEPATFECSLGGPFTPCSSGDSFGPLANGSYTFSVRAIDLASNVDPSPATRSFEIRACTITGTPGNDALHGTFGHDVICGLGGSDKISSSPGNDIVFGGDGADVIQGGFGAERLLGGAGNDTITAGPGADEIDGGSGTDTCQGGLGTDTATDCENVSGVP
jgi:Ca2+-binding RTX toxin-like protein